MTFENIPRSLFLRIQVPYPFLLSLTYIPGSLIEVMTTSGWCHRPTDVTSTPLRDHWEQPRFYLSSNPLYDVSPFTSSTDYLFPKLNGRVLSHSCGYSCDQRAWTSFRDIHTIVYPSIIHDYARFVIAEGIALLLFTIVPSFSQVKFLKYFDCFQHLSYRFHFYEFFLVSECSILFLSFCLFFFDGIMRLDKVRN